MINDPEVYDLLGSPLPVVAAGPKFQPRMGFPGGAFEGASLFDRQLALWNPASKSADADILPDKKVADARVRDTLRNDSLVAAGADIHRDSVIGSMFLLNAKPNLEVLRLEETWAEEFQEEVEAKFTLWAESHDHWLDAARLNTLTSMLRVDIGVYLAAGEILSTVEWLRDGVRPYNTAIQMVDLDRLTNPNGASDTVDLRGGVARNRFGAPQGYHIRMRHPSDFTLNPTDMFSWKYIPVRKPWGRLQVIHIFEQDRPDQTRGMSGLVSALKELRIVKKFRDVVLQNAVLNATFAASIESEFPDQAMAAIGGVDFNEAFTSYLDSYLTAVTTYSGGAKNLVLDGVKVPHLFPGTKLQLRPAGTGGPLGSDFETSCLRYLAATLGVSYEELSRDYTKTNYSSARAAMGNTERHLKARKKMVADRKATAIYALWLEEAMNKGDIESMPRNAPNFYEGLNSAAYTACDWIGASRGQIDELKETQAAVLRLKFNLSTLEDELARFGKDWRKVLIQREREMKELKSRGIDPNPEDNSLNAASGDVRESSGDGATVNDQPEERRG